MYLVHARELLDLSGHDATVVPLPRPHVALAAWRDRAALLTPDLQIWRLARGRWSYAYTADASPDPALAALSVDGSLIAIADTEESEPRVLHENASVYYESYDFYHRTTSLYVHPDGGSWGYGFLTEQPWSEWGSYGDRLLGFMVCDATGATLRVEQDHRAHDEFPVMHGFWDPHANLLATVSVEDGDAEMWELEWAAWVHGPDSWSPSIPEHLRQRAACDRAIPCDPPMSVSPDGFAVAAIVRGEPVLVVRERLGTTGRTGALTWFEQDVVAISLDAWPTVTTLRRDGVVMRIDAEDVLAIDEELYD